MDANSLEFKPQRPARERSVRRRGLARNRSESNATKTLARTWRARTQTHAKASPPLLFHTHTMSRAARRDTRQGGAPVGQERVVQQRRCPGHVAHEARVPDTHVRTRDLPPSTHLASAAAQQPPWCRSVLQPRAAAGPNVVVRIGRRMRDQCLWRAALHARTSKPYRSRTHSKKRGCGKRDGRGWRLADG